MPGPRGHVPPALDVGRGEHRPRRGAGRSFSVPGDDAAPGRERLHARDLLLHDGAHERVEDEVRSPDAQIRMPPVPFRDQGMPRCVEAVGLVEFSAQRRQLIERPRGARAPRRRADGTPDALAQRQGGDPDGGAADAPDDAAGAQGCGREVGRVVAAVPLRGHRATDVDGLRRPVLALEGTIGGDRQVAWRLPRAHLGRPHADTLRRPTDIAASGGPPVCPWPGAQGGAGRARSREVRAPNRARRGVRDQKRSGEGVPWP